MGKVLKTALIVLVLAFAIYYLYTRPEAAADAVKAVLGMFDSLGRFFASLAR